MKKTLYHLPGLFLVLGVFLSSGQFAHAAQLTLPQQFSYAGLTFIQPLTYDKPSQKVNIKTETLTFSIPEKLAVANTTEGTEKVDSEAALIPTIAMTLPVLPSQTPPAFQEPSKEPTPSTTTVNKATNQSTEPEKTKTIVFSTEEVTDAPTPTPTKAPAPVNPVTTVSSNPGGLNADVLFSLVNNYRTSQGLPAFQKDDRSCSLAASRAPEINGEIASGTMHSGLRARALPYWNTENIISMNSEAAAFNWWINDKIHHDAIVGNYTYSCVACSGNACAEEFTNFQAK
jgi:uncharacterized protein YkwD